MKIFIILFFSISSLAQDNEQSKKPIDTNLTGTTRYDLGNNYLPGYETNNSSSAKDNKTETYAKRLPPKK